MDSVPKAASFLAFVPRDTILNRKTKLRLYCAPTFKTIEIIDLETRLQNEMIGDGSSDEPMYDDDKAFMFLSKGVVEAIRPNLLQRFHLR